MVPSRRENLTWKFHIKVLRLLFGNGISRKVSGWRVYKVRFELESFNSLFFSHLKEKFGELQECLKIMQTCSQSQGLHWFVEGKDSLLFRVENKVGYQKEEDMLEKVQRLIGERMLAIFLTRVPNIYLFLSEWWHSLNLRENVSEMGLKICLTLEHNA